MQQLALDIPLDEVKKICKKWKIQELSVFGFVITHCILVAFNYEATRETRDLYPAGQAKLARIGDGCTLCVPRGIQPDQILLGFVNRGPLPRFSFLYILVCWIL